MACSEIFVTSLPPNSTSPPATRPGGGTGAGEAELTFAFSLLGMLGLGLVLTVAVLSLL